MRTEAETTIRSREPGEELRTMRLKLDLRAEHLSKSLGWSLSRISRLEHGSRGATAFDVGTLLGRLEADPPTRARVARLIEEHDLGHYIRPHHHRLFVDARMGRQDIYVRNAPPQTTFYIHEAALQAVVGGNKVMHDQLMRLRFMGTWSHMDLRVVPLSAVGHHLVRSPFNLMTFDTPIDPVACAETDTASLFIDDRDAIKTYKRHQKLLARIALSAEQSRAVFAYWADIYDRREDRDDRGTDLA
ncbi:helix-turn-helix transcriptional regulator [Actinosynnema sp. NPDC020468]|uniref:helix-turn-helix domain-containing protein n=1 Tax=Actinosynnema sp. NPDC020468 TaxID=3154488 RepID=UPI0033E74893